MGIGRGRRRLPGGRCHHRRPRRQLFHFRGGRLDCIENIERYGTDRLENFRLRRLPDPHGRHLPLQGRQVVQTRIDGDLLLHVRPLRAGLPLCDFLL